MFRPMSKLRTLFSPPERTAERRSTHLIDDGSIAHHTTARSTEPVDPLTSYSRALHKYTLQQWLEARNQAEKEAQQHVSVLGSGG